MAWFSTEPRCFSLFFHRTACSFWFRLLEYPAYQSASSFQIGIAPFMAKLIIDALEIVAVEHSITAQGQNNMQIRICRAKLDKSVFASV